MNVLVIGGTGWVGHNIVKVFCKAGYDVTIMSRGKKSTFAEHILPEVDTVIGDKNNVNDMKRIFKKQYDIVIDSFPREAGVENIVQFSGKITHYLHCSSTGGYAPLSAIPGDETMPYDSYLGGWKVKDIMDTRVLELFRATGFPATVIRPSYITGPGMVPIDNLGGRREDFLADIINEKEIDLPNYGQALLHPVHVEDLAQFFLLAVQNPRSKGEIYNASLEKAVTITDYVKINAEAFNKTPKINYLSIEEMLEKYPDISETGLRFFAEHMCYDISKAKTQLNYVPHCTTQEAIVENALWVAEKLRLIS